MSICDVKNHKQHEEKNTSAAIDSMFNGKTDGYLSVYNFFKALSYDKIHYNTVYTNDIQNSQIVSYQDVFPRGYFEPYSAWNPIGYQGENPFMGVSMREALLLGRVVNYVDSLHLVDSNIVLDDDIGSGDRRTLSVSHLPKGLYILKAYSDNGSSQSRKVVVE